MEQVTLSKLIQELLTLKHLHGDLNVYHITYGAVEQVYTVRVEVLLKKDNEKAVVLY
jgi:hypothetical protein